MVFASPAGAYVNAQHAGLQVALRALGLYHGPIDGLVGPQTVAAVRAAQQRAHLRVTGLADKRTRWSLGPLGRPLFGSRVMRPGLFGYDVSVLQFLLTRRGVYSGALDGYMGKETTAALRRYQRSMHLTPDAVVGPRTLTVFVRRDSVPVRTKPSPSTGSALYVVHVVHAGDSLTAIAQAHDTSIRRLASLNHLDVAKPILIGQRLKVPTVMRTALSAQSGAVPAVLDEWSSRLGVDKHLVRALAWMESGYNNAMVSSVGAQGVMQLLPTTWKYVEDVLIGHRIADHGPDGNVHVGMAYLHHLLQVFNGNEHLALAGWYQGERAVRKHGPYKVTRPFVANVLALRTRM